MQDPEHLIVPNPVNIHQAIFFMQPSSVPQFLNAVSLNAQDSIGDPPLHAAVMTNQPEIVLLLLQKGAQLDKKNKDGYTALDIALLYHRHTCIPLLIHYSPSKEWILTKTLEFYSDKGEGIEEEKMVLNRIKKLCGHQVLETFCTCLNDRFHFSPSAKL